MDMISLKEAGCQLSKKEFTLSKKEFALLHRVRLQWTSLMALYVSEITEEQRSLLQEMANGDDVIRTRWAQVILLSTSGIGVPKIADTLELSSATVRARIKAFNEQGMDALKRSTSPGRPETISPSLGDKFAALMRERDPRDFGWSDTGWTLDLLVKVATLEGWVESISREGVRLALRKSKHRYRRLKNWTKHKSSDKEASVPSTGDPSP
jgi:transposase